MSAAARVLASLGERTTDIFAGCSIPVDPGLKIFDRQWREAARFNSYGARRGNHEVMVRGTFANIGCVNNWRGTEGGWTLFCRAAKNDLYDAAVKYREAEFRCW